MSEQQPPKMPLHPDVESHFNLFYSPSNHPEQSLDLFVPKKKADSETLPPLLVYIHGGAWRSGDKNEYTYFADFFVPKGFALAVINYRLCKKDAPPLLHPEHLNDCALSIHWLSQHASKYGYDANNIYLSGHSAGGQLTGLLVLDPQNLERLGGRTLYNQIKGCVGIQGIYDIPTLIQVWPTYIDFIEMAFTAKDKDLWKRASPQYANLPQGYELVPYLIVHSPEDELVDPPQAQKYVEHLKSLQEGKWTNRVNLEMDVKNKHFEMLREENFMNKMYLFLKGLL